MDRTAFVARTAHDLKHGNRLRAPVYGAVKICLKAGKTASKSYQPDGAPAQKQESGATDDFHFAPIKEKVKILYKIDDAAACITKAKIELFRRNVAAAVWTVDLKEEEFTDGEHEREWDGKITKDAKEFPEGCVTVQHSPYKLKITVEGQAGYGFPLMAWTYFHILVHEIELELGPKEVVPNATAKEKRDKALYDTLGGKLPAPDAKAPLEINLISHLFSIGGTDKKDNTLYKEYKKLWEEGPSIPIFAKAYIRNSSDKKEDVPQALGRVGFLWDWKDEPEELSRHYAKGKEFLKNTLNFDKATSKPPGDNCFGSSTNADDRGGKRGSTTRLVFPAMPGYPAAAALTADKFPFEVKQCGTRKWCSYSFSWATGKLMGKTGVLFQPSRMAGDNLRVLVYCAHSRKPDGTDNLDTEDNDFLKQAVKKSTGIFQVWRELHIASYRRKDASITAIDLAKVATYYEKAYIKLLDKSGGIVTFTNYNTNLRAKVGALADHIQAAVEAGDQGTITKAGVRYRAHAAFVTQLETLRGVPAGSLSGPGGWLVTNGLDTPAGYQGSLEGFTDQFVPQSLVGVLAAADGINICQFQRYWEITGGGFSGTSGFASTDVPGISLNKTAYLQCAADVDYPAMFPPPQVNNMQLTTTHEIGHCCFLPHAPTAGGNVPALHDLPAHWNNCTMSYNYDKERHFCGLCMLRLRGWKPVTVPADPADPTNMNSDSTLNKRP